MQPNPGKEELKAIFERRVCGADTPDIELLAAALGAFYDEALKLARGEFCGPQLGLPCSRFICTAADMAVEALRERLAAQQSGSAAEFATAWLAVGGYGRGLLSPDSSANLLVLHDAEAREDVEGYAKTARAALARAVPGSELRCSTIEDALQGAADDFIGASDLLQTRLVGGSGELYAQFTGALTRNFLVPRWGKFCADLLGESLARRDPYTSSPYCTEPNLKEGTGCLRDIGMMQKIAASLLDVPALERFWGDTSGGETGLLTVEERRILDEAFEFILSARNSLHFLVEGKSDVLERRFQAEVARMLGYGPRPAEDAAVRGFMRDLFGHTGRISRLLKAFQERFDHLHSVAWQQPRPRSRKDIGDGFAVVEGKIYSATHPAFSAEDGAHKMMRAFLLSQRHHLPMSQRLLDEIAESLDTIGEQALWARDAASLFLELLSGSVGVAQRLRWMRECGLLQRFIPEFQELVHTVQYDESFDYTLDEHAIEAVQVVDELAHTDEEDELPQRELLSQTERPDLLRLALLLHHAVQEGDEADNMVRAIGKRMHLSRREIELLLFLIGHRDTLTYYAERRDFHDPGVLQEAARQVGDAQNLRLLYVFTYADCRAVGRAGWFAWRDTLLYELYQHLMAALVPGFEPRATAEYFESEMLRLAQQEGLSDAARDFIAMVPEQYKVEVPAAQALAHLALIRRTRQQPAAMSYHIQGRQAHLWFCSSDLPARFSQIAGSLTANGLSIVRARAFTLADGTGRTCR